MKRRLIIAFYTLAAIAGVAWPLLLVPGCGAVSPQVASGIANVIHGTLGGMYGACQAVDVDNRTWRNICDSVEKALPPGFALGAGDAELPPDVANRPVMIMIGAEAQDAE